MNFREIENLENKAVASDSLTFSSTQLEMIAEYIEKEKLKLKWNENPFVYFYEDVISSSIGFDFKTSIGERIYKNASDDALSCLKVCNEFSKLSTWEVISWLQTALKFTDNIVLHYIQDCCKEKPKSYSNAGVEKARYIQLSENNGEISIAGAELKDLYDLRNKFEHRTRTRPDGTQELIPPKRNKIRVLVVKLYPDILTRILKTYKSFFINQNI